MYARILDEVCANLAADTMNELQYF